MTDIAKLILDADTTGLVKANTALRDLSQSAKTTAQDVSALRESFGAAGVGVLGFMNGAQRAKVEITDLKTGMEDVNKTSGSARQGMQQLGYQLGDVATMFSLGAKPAQIFASQIGQITQAVQLMAGGTSRVAAFLGGPWGIALSVGVVALTPFIGKLWDTYNAANAATGALEGLIQKERQRAKEARVLKDSEKDLNALIKQRDDLIKGTGSNFAATARFGDVGRAANDNTAQIIALNKQIAEARNAVDQERVSRLGLGSVRELLGGTATAAPAAATGITSVSRALKSANDNAVSFKDNMQSAMDTLAQFKREMASGGVFSSAANQLKTFARPEGELSELRNRAAGVNAFDSSQKGLYPFYIKQDMDALNVGLTQLHEKTEEARNRTETGTKAIAESFRTMATDALAALDRLAAGIESGNFLSILSGVVDIGLQLGGMGVFGKETQANILSSRGRANGGSVSAGRAYVVGENRPEVFIPDTNGRIQPSVGSGGGQVIVINNSALADVYVDGRVQAAAPAIVSASANYTQSTMARRSTRRVA